MKAQGPLGYASVCRHYTIRLQYLIDSYHAHKEGESPETCPSSSPKLASVLSHSLARALLGHGFLVVPAFP